MHKFNIPISLSHVSVLEALIKFKESDKIEFPKHLITALLCNVNKIHFEEIQRLIFNNKETTLTTNEKIKILENEINKNLVWKGYKIENGEIICFSTLGYIEKQNLETKENDFYSIYLLEPNFFEIFPEQLYNDLLVEKQTKLKKYFARKHLFSNKNSAPITNDNQEKKVEKKTSKKVNKNHTETSLIVDESTISIISNTPLNLNSGIIVNENGEIGERFNAKNRSSISSKSKNSQDSHSRSKKDKKMSQSLDLAQFFNLKKVEKKTEIEENDGIRFKPLEKTYDFEFKYFDNRFQKIFTVRKKRDIRHHEINKKITFVKFHDQIKPPIYEIRDKVGNRISHKRIIEMFIDYEKDSDDDWFVEEGEDIDTDTSDTISEDTEVSESESDWTDKENEPDFEDSRYCGNEVKYIYKKPEINFNVPKTEFFKNFDPKCLSVPLLRSKTVSDELKVHFINEYSNRKNKDEFIKEFGLEYRVVNSALVKLVKDKKVNLNIT
ncbi:hypothetical protein EDEG_00444 [Edhazardia aedis USNM 41457]|uniref:Uncharacterized protein n=1 Tax=Edhazardia aedis (strain USNM 41457) TaxID=1003232 RepID=J9DJ97_EDHAE|nr:hypothetical protein EDEG_00444 [Edhazardia aedis USNM 41457]|eukprot:EJW01452.1 hypothetical protein EDEG_00444 [Edhazardia aedis USNM 41457]